MELWQTPCITAVAGGKKSTLTYAVEALRRRLREEGWDEEDIEKEVLFLKDRWHGGWAKGTAKAVKPLKPVAESTRRRKEREEFKAAKKLIEDEVKRLFEEAPEGWEESLEILQRMMTALEDGWKEKLKARRNKAKGIGGGLGFTRLVIFQAPRWTEKQGGPKLERKPSLMFGPWWKEPDTSKAECEAWKEMDLLYQWFPEAQKKFYKTLCYDPKKSVYDHWMEYSMPYALRGIRPASYPFSLKWEHPHVSMGGVAQAVGGSYVNLQTDMDALGRAFQKFGPWIAAGIVAYWLMHKESVVLPMSFSNRHKIFPEIRYTEFAPYWHYIPKYDLFDPRQLYAAYVGIFNDMPPPNQNGIYSLLAVTLRTSHWQNFYGFPGPNVKELPPTKARFMVRATTKDGKVRSWVKHDSFVANEDIYIQLCYPSPIKSVEVYYIPGKVATLTRENYLGRLLPCGVVDYNPWPPFASDPPAYTLGSFDGLHAWVHWPWPLDATRYSLARMPDWWGLSSIVWEGATFYRVRPPHPYTGHRILRPY